MVIYLNFQQRAEEPGAPAVPQRLSIQISYRSQNKMRPSRMMEVSDWHGAIVDRPSRMMETSHSGDIKCIQARIQVKKNPGLAGVFGALLNSVTYSASAQAPSNKVFSSPSSCISVTISQPPTNSPLTHSCGKVGHWA